VTVVTERSFAGQKGARPSASSYVHSRSRSCGSRRTTNSLCRLRSLSPFSPTPFRSLGNPVATSGAHTPCWLGGLSGVGGRLLRAHLPLRPALLQQPRQLPSDSSADATMATLLWRSDRGRWSSPAQAIPSSDKLPTTPRFCNHKAGHGRGLHGPHGLRSLPNRRLQFPIRRS
jgi:hypothetical protein